MGNHDKMLGNQTRVIGHSVEKQYFFSVLCLCHNIIMLIMMSLITLTTTTTIISIEEIEDKENPHPRIMKHNIKVISAVREEQF